MKNTIYLILFIIFFNHTALAVNVQQFNRSSSLTYEMIEDARLLNSHVKNKYRYLINLGVSHVDEPLTVKNKSNTEQTDSIINNMNSIHLGLSTYLFPKTQLSFDTAYSFYKNNNGDQISDFQDINIKLKQRIISKERWALSLMPKLVIPLKGGNTLLYDNSTPPFSYGRDNTLSDDGLGLGLMAIYEQLFAYFQLSLNLSYYYNDKAKFTDGFNQTHIDKSQVISTGLGVYVPFHEKIGLNLELIKNYYNPFFNSNLNPSEVFLGFSAGLSQSVHAFIGAGFGNFLSGSDGNDYRMVSGVKIIPFYKDKKNASSLKGQFDKRPTRIIEAREKYCVTDKFFGETNAFTILFDHDSYQISNKQKQSLSAIANILKSRLDEVESIIVNGHTSRLGDEDYNYTLGLKRVNVISNYFLEKGIKTEYITVRSSKGELDPLIGEGNSKAKFNRRTEVLVELKNKENDCEG